MCVSAFFNKINFMITFIIVDNYQKQLVQSQILNNSPYTMSPVPFTRKSSNNVYNENINNEFIQKDSLDLYNDINPPDFSRKSYISNLNNNDNYQSIPNMNNVNYNSNNNYNQINNYPNNNKPNNYSDIHHKNFVIKNNHGLSNLGKSIVFSENTSSDFFRNGVTNIKPSNNNVYVLNGNKDILDYEISKLENQYKEIVDKFNYLTQKRKMME
jgi:hypothetical protein